MSTCLIIRAKEDADKTIIALKNKGYSDFIIEPIFSVEKIAPKPIGKKPQALIITSKNACDAILKAGFDYNIKIFAVGRKSAKNLVAAGYNNIFYSPENSAASLEKMLREKLDYKNGKIIYFCGNFITLNFALSLQPLGFEIENILAYKINWHQNFSADFLQKIAKKQQSNEKVDFILFYSQNSVKKFYELAKINNLLEYFNNSTLLCISEKIAASAKKLGCKNIEIFYV